MAVALHLSRLAPPGPRAHHRRIARAILEDTAQRHEGQVFALGSGDLVLLCRRPPPGRMRAAEFPHGLGVPDPAALPATMAALLRVDLPDPAHVTTVWPLPESLAAFTAYAAERVAESAPAAAPAAEPAELTVVVGALAAIAEGPAGIGFLRWQAGVLVPAPHRPTAPPLLPLYRELGFSIAALEARLAAPGQAAADPFLFRHLAARLDQRMLALLSEAAGTGGALDLAAAPGTPPLHLNLTLPTILSDDFARFARRCRDSGAPVGVEVALLEACGDAAAFAAARRVLAEAGMALVLDGVSHLALLLARLDALRPDLLKLAWSPVLADLAAADRQQIAATLDRIGRDRVVLHRAGSEAALRWGMAQGIRRFQGRHVDAMLAAGHSQTCPRAPACSLRQCIERAAAIVPDEACPPPPAPRRAHARAPRAAA